MPRSVKIAAAADLPPGQCRAITVEDRAIALCNVGGVFHAVEGVCTHDYALLGHGTLDGDTLMCPLHGACFSVKSGEALTPPAYDPIKTFPVRVEGDNVVIELED